jgi:L-ascorbate metabolism protein UlaG (beta-lactamase superfamily)
VLIRCGEHRIVTDPWLSDRIGPWRRLRAPGFDAAQLTPLDAVLISHAHPDHLDPATLRLLPPDTPVLTPSGPPERRLRGLGMMNRHVLKEWLTWSVGGLSVTAVPSIHTRGSLGYVVETGGGRVYFAGDAGPRTPFEEIGKRCGPVAVALIPVGGSSLAWGPLQRHLTPALAARAAAAIRPQVVIPIHWGHVPCIPAPLDRFRGTPGRFLEEMRQFAPDIRVLCPEEGEVAVVSR